MRRVLFIAYLFPPVANSGTRRSLSFVNHLPDCGWEPLVMGWAPDPGVGLEPEMLAEVRPGTRVERVPLQSRVLAMRLTRFLPRALRTRIEDGLAWRMRARATVPDEAAGWFKPCVKRALELHRQQGFDVIYASGWPWTSFLIAQEVSRLTGKPYVLDYRDQWTPSGDMAWEHATAEQRERNPGLERRAGQGAAAVITVTGALVTSVGRDCGRTDLRLITNGFEPADFAAPAPALDDGLKRLVYTGVWRPGYGLHELYEAIRLLKSQGHAELDRLRVQAAGFAPGPAQEAGVADWVTEMGRVPHGVAVTLMKQAGLLYLPVPTGYYAMASLPGKLFEYLGCGRPILAIVPEGSEVGSVLASTGGGVRVEPGDVPGLARVLLAWLKDDLQVGAPQGIERFTRASTTRQLADVLDGVVAGQAQGSAR